MPRIALLRTKRPNMFHVEIAVDSAEFLRRVVPMKDVKKEKETQ